MALEGYVSGPLLEALNRTINEIRDAILAFFENDRQLRSTQAKNEPIAAGFQQGVNTGTAETISFPLNTTSPSSPFACFLAGQDENQVFAYIEIVIASTSGSGRHNGGDTSCPLGTIAGIGHEIPLGGTVITIPGTVNVRQFRMLADAGQTLNYSMQGFK